MHATRPTVRVPAWSLETRGRHGVFGIGIAALHAVQHSHDRCDRQAVHEERHQHDQSDDRPQTRRVLQIIDVGQAIGLVVERPDAPDAEEGDRQSFMPRGADARHAY